MNGDFMLFDPLSWAIGYVFEKGVNRLFSQDLVSKLQKLVIQWAADIPSEKYVYPDTLFPRIESIIDPNQRPALYKIRQILIENRLPTEVDWLNACIEQWRLIRNSSNIDEAQPFFQLDESDAKVHLTILAKSLSEECKQDNKLFCINVINKLSGHDFNWEQIKQNANDYLKIQLQHHNYQLFLDVKQHCIEDILPLINDNQITVLSGNSGDGKSWLMYSVASVLDTKGELVILIDASDNATVDIQTAAETFLHEIKIDNSPGSMRSIVASLKQSGHWKNHWLTLLIDGVQNKDEIATLINQPWESWGVKLVISCLPEMIETVAEHVKSFSHFKTNGFNVSELHEYLRLRLKKNWYGIPSNVVKILQRPLLAKIYCDIAEGKSWQPQNEYELFDKYWARIDTGMSLDSAKLKNLAHSVLCNNSYPWLNNCLLQNGIDNETLTKLIKLGWLQKTSSGCFEICHDRLLNWAVAESLITALQTNEMDLNGFYNQLKELYKSEHTYCGKYLGYIPMDVVWMAVNRNIIEIDRLSQMVESLEDAGWLHKEILYSQLLPTIGPKILPVLFKRLESVITKGDILTVNLIINAINSYMDSNVVTLARKLLMTEQPSFQLAAMKIFSHRPDKSVLDRLWELHCKITSFPELYIKANESNYFLYRDSFGALLSCTKLNPDWVEHAINYSVAGQPIHDLAYLLANLDNGKKIWEKCKKTLFEKVDSSKVRSLAKNISKYCDKDEIGWLLQNIGNSDDLVGPSALYALMKIDPELAVQEISRLPNFELYLTRQWCFYEILIRRPNEIYKKLLEMMKTSTDVWTIAHVFQGNENLMSEEILNYLLNCLESLLDKELSEKRCDNTDPLFRPLLLLSEVDRFGLLKCFQLKKDTALESKLTSWLYQRGLSFDRVRDNEQECAIKILYKINGSGFTEVVNSLLDSKNFYGEYEGIKQAIKRHNQQTIELLIRISQQDRLSQEYPINQQDATFILAQLNQVDAVIGSILKWGSQTDSKVAHWKLDDLPISANVLSDIFRNLESSNEKLAGAVLTVGITGRKDKLDNIHKILNNSLNDSGIIRACILAIGRLQDNSPETIEIISKNLESEKYNHVAKIALFQIGSNLALDKLLYHLKDQYDGWLAINLLEYEHTFDGALNEIKKYLENQNERAKLEFLNQLYEISPDHKALQVLLMQLKYKDAVRTAIYMDENSNSWHEGLKANSIAILAKFDKEAAFEAAWMTLQDTKAHDRKFYPPIMILIDKKLAIPLLLLQLGIEESCGVVRTIAKSLNSETDFFSIAQLLESTNSCEKPMAINLIGWSDYSLIYEQKLIEYLDDSDEHINFAIKESLNRIFNLREANKLLDAIKSESDINLKWIYLDSLLILADPGDKHMDWPDWALELFKVLPAEMQYYFSEKLKERRNNYDKEINEKDKQLQNQK